MKIIKEIRFSPSEPKPGQPVKIEVMGNNGKPLTKKITVYINHIPSSTAFMQFANEGEFEIVVKATSKNAKEKLKKTIKVVGEPLTIMTSFGPKIPYLKASPMFARPRSVALSIGNHLDGAKENARGEVVEYQWEFGNGKNVKSKTSSVQFDYSELVSPTENSMVFDIYCTPLNKLGKPIKGIDTVKRTLVINSAYGILKNKFGIIHPPSKTEEQMGVVNGFFVASMFLRNLEDEDILLTHHCIMAVTQNSATMITNKVEKLKTPISIIGGKSAKFQIKVPVSKIQSETNSLEIIYSGTLKSGNKVRVRGMYDLPFVPRPHIKKVLRPQILKPGRIKKPNIFLFAVFGETCEPENISREDQAIANRDGLVCQLTDETITRTLPARFVNARKGDIVLSPGGSGLIGKLLTQISPPQHYSHCGIMTRNYDEIAHSTASMERLRANKAGRHGLPGFKEDALKWMWPGPVVQSIENAVYGEDWTDPTGTRYSISSFNNRTVDEDFVITEPIILKPDPLLEVERPEIREQLHEVAEEALNAASRRGNRAMGHYSLHCYTSAKTGLDYSAPDDSGWAAGTYPSMCSSFIWLAAKRAGVQLESSNEMVSNNDLERSDIQTGAEVDENTLDGLYHYDEEERIQAGEWLYEEIRKMVKQGPGPAGGTFFGTPKRYANQVCNTFANGDSSTDARRDDAWETPGIGTTVSPDDLMLWDSPENGGLWGYAEPLLYREPRAQSYRVSRWNRIERTSILTGVVTLGGRPVSRTNVHLSGTLGAVSNAEGRFTISEVPWGEYTIRASLVREGVNFTESRDISVNSENMTVNLTLEEPPSRFRLVEIDYEFEGVDDERRNDEIERGRGVLRAELGPDRLTNSLTRVYKWGGELRVEYDFDLTLLPDNTTRVSINARMFEGTSEDNNDLDDNEVTSVIVRQDGNSSFYNRLYNNERRGGDWAILRGTINNRRNNT